MTSPVPPPPSNDEGIRLTEDERMRQTKRSRAIALAIVALVVLFYVITVLKMGPPILQRPL